MLTILCASLALAAPAPKAGHYYREAFADAVAKGTFDPDAYADHREPSIRWTPPRATVDHGQSTVIVEIKSTKTGTTVGYQAREAKGAWRAIVLDALAPDRVSTDLGGQVETWVRLPDAFDALVKKTRAERTKAQRAKLAGKYTAADGATLELKASTGFKLERCMESCKADERAWCVVHKRVSYVVDGTALVETAPPQGLCPDAPAFEKKEGARRFTRR